MKKRTAEPKLSKKLQARLDSFEGHKSLDLSGVENESIGAADIDYLQVHSAVSDLLVQNFKGTLDVGRAEQLVTCRKLRLENCRLKAMTASRAAFENCEFIDCDFAALRAIGASFVRCIFKGVIKSGIFDCKGVDPGFQGALPFEGNDFRHCDLRDTAFRGGVDLRKQIFNEEQQRLIIPGAAKLLGQLDVFIAKSRAGPGFKRFRDHLHRSVVDFEQEQVFVSKDLLRKYWQDSPDLLDRCAAISPDFSLWASGAEGFCTTPPETAKSRKA